MSDKNRFSLKSDIIHLVSQMPNEKAGELFKHILLFVTNEDPENNDPLVKMAFEPIKKDLLEDMQKKEAFRIKCSESGKKSAELRQNKKEKKSNVRQGTSRYVKVPQGTLKVDHQEIINIFNSVCIELPKTSLTDKRVKLIDALLKMYTLDQIGCVFQNASESDYLNGKIKDWKASLDWILNPTNFIKVLEGNYANITQKKSSENLIKAQIKEAQNTVNNYFR